MLLRRWLARRPGEAVGEALAPEQRGALAAELARERACLLACLEALMLHRYATAEGGDGGARRALPRSRSRALLGKLRLWLCRQGRHMVPRDSSLCPYLLSTLPARTSLMGHHHDLHTWQDAQRWRPCKSGNSHVHYNTN